MATAAPWADHTEALGTLRANESVVITANVTETISAIHFDDGQRVEQGDILNQLKQLGYETGSGVMIGIPGQTYTTLANDINTFRQYDMDMVGVGWRRLRLARRLRRRASASVTLQVAVYRPGSV